MFGAYNQTKSLKQNNWNERNHCKHHNKSAETSETNKNKWNLIPLLKANCKLTSIGQANLSAI